MEQTTVFSHFLVTCQLNQYFDEANKFDPDRWLSGTMSKESKFASLPFGFGPRMCAGRRFAELELMMATAKLVLNFQMDSSMKTLERKHEFIVVPSHPIQIRFKSRMDTSIHVPGDRLQDKESNGSKLSGTKTIRDEQYTKKRIKS